MSSKLALVALCLLTGCARRAAVPPPAPAPVCYTQQCIDEMEKEVRQACSWEGRCSPFP
jgi:hypothetical protein